MPRRTRSQPQKLEDKCCPITILLDQQMATFLEVEAKRLSEKEGRKIYPVSIVRALISSYYEKRIIGLVSCPDD